MGNQTLFLGLKINIIIMNEINVNTIFVQSTNLTTI